MWIIPLPTLLRLRGFVSEEYTSRAQVSACTWLAWRNIPEQRHADVHVFTAIVMKLLLGDWQVCLPWYSVILFLVCVDTVSCVRISELTHWFCSLFCSVIQKLEDLKIRNYASCMERGGKMYSCDENRVCRMLCNVCRTRDNFDNIAQMLVQHNRHTDQTVHNVA